MRPFIRSAPRAGKLPPRQPVWAAAVVTAVLCLPACSISPNPAPTSEDLIGAWVNGKTLLVVHSDGTFDLENAPAYGRVGQTEQWRDRAADLTWNETGEWNIEFDAIRISGQKFYYQYIASELTLEIGLDMGSDDPRCFELVRKDSSLTARGPEDCFIRP